MPLADWVFFIAFDRFYFTVFNADFKAADSLTKVAGDVMNTI
jgi:hypothetical protein